MRPGQNWRDLMPACACCGRAIVTPKSQVFMDGIGVMHGHCAWDVEKIARDLLDTQLFNDERDAVNLAYRAQNEIVISMVAEWLVEWMGKG